MQVIPDVGEWPTLRRSAKQKWKSSASQPEQCQCVRTKTKTAL